MKEPVKLADIKAVEAKVVFKPKKDPSKVPIGEKIDLVLAEDKTIFDFDKSVKSCTINYLDISGTNYFANSNKILH